jgi:glycine dehydrogenase subunit 2
MGFDVIHMNLHKTFSTPHGGGGPGAGPIGVNKRLEPFMPIPIVAIDKENKYVWMDKDEKPLSIGRLSTFMGNSGILLRAYIYALLLGKQGLERVAEFSCLNANYLMKGLQEAGFELAFPQRRASHEFIISLKSLKKEYGITAMEFAKRLLDYGVHAPTTYFPMLVPECFLIEPTETESLQTLDEFIKIMKAVLDEAKTNPELLHNAPYSLPIRRLDDVKAARKLDVNYFYKKEG